MFSNNDFYMDPMENMRRMESMMDSMMNPFGMNRNRGMLMPFGFGGSLFPSMGDMFGNFSAAPDCHSFSSSSVMSYTTDEHGRPQVYQASSSTRSGPGGVKETRRSVQDSRTGLQQMAIGHHLHDRGHVVEKKRNRYTGDQEDNEEFVNLDDTEADQFENEWRQQAQAHGRLQLEEGHHRMSPRQQLAITDGAVPETSGKKKTGKHKKKHQSRSSPYQ